MRRRHIAVAISAALVVLAVGSWYAWRRHQRSIPDELAADNKASVEQVEAVERAFKKLGILPGRSTPEYAAEGIPLRHYYMPSNTDDDDLDGLPRVPFRFGLVFPSGQITDEGLEKLARRRNLVYLDLSGTPITDAGLKHLAPLTHLARLNLPYTKIGDEGIKELAALPNLTWLELQSTRVTEAGIRELAAIKSLKVVRLDPHLLTDESVKTLSDLNLLHPFGWGQTVERDDRLARIAGLAPSGKKAVFAASPRHVVALSLGGTKVTDKGLPVIIAAFPNLAQLELSAHPFSGESLRALGSLSNFKTLMLGPEQIRDDVLKAFLEMKKLHTFVNFTRTDMPPREDIVLDEQLRMLPTLPQGLAPRPVSDDEIVCLDLSSCGITDNGLKHIAALKNLKAIILTRTAITDAGLVHLAGVKKLELILLNETGVSEAGQLQIKKLFPNCKVR